MLNFGNITDIMNEAQANSPELSGFETPTNTSAASVWEMAKSLFGFLASQLQSDLDKAQEQITISVNTKRFGSQEWYVSEFKKFQWGDNLKVINGVLGYPIISQEKQIIGRVRMVTGNVGDNKLTAYVSGKTLRNINGINTLKLVNEELDTVQEYANKIAIIGLPIRVLSTDSDKIHIGATIKINKLILNDNGSSKTSPTVYPIVEYIKIYLSRLQEDESLFRSSLMSFLAEQNEVEAITLSIQRQNGSTVSVLGPKVEIITSVSGVYEFDTLSIIDYV
jgi:hypothetical protein